MKIFSAQRLIVVGIYQRYKGLVKKQKKKKGRGGQKNRREREKK